MEATMLEAFQYFESRAIQIKKSLDTFSIKSVILHLLKENVYQHNLIRDISNVYYVKNYEGVIRLKTLSDLYTIINNLCLFG